MLFDLRFVELPRWVKVIQTSRPDPASMFTDKRWSAKTIEPSDEHNQTDVRLLLQAKVKATKHVAEEDVLDVADILLSKSKVGGSELVIEVVGTRHPILVGLKA
jgi:hypothetical protein